MQTQDLKFLEYSFFAKNVAKILLALSLQWNHKGRISYSNLAENTQFFLENVYFKRVKDIIVQKNNIYKFCMQYL